MSYVTWIDPWKCDPPHRVTHEEHVDELAVAIHNQGWSGPALLGYELDGRIQLVSGSHRHAAAKRLGITLPVVISPYPLVRDIFGTDKWIQWLHSAPDVQR